LDEMMPAKKNVEFPYLLLWSILFLAQKSWLALLQSRRRRGLHEPLSSSSPRTGTRRAWEKPWDDWKVMCT
jgi:hypothetical protein